MRIELTVFVGVLVMTSLAAAADYNAGAAAYKAGDYAAALKEWLPLAELGDAAAQNAVGALYYHGRGVAQDYVKALHWYSLSAEQRLSVAQNNLGYCYFKGHGVPQNYRLAYMWFFLAGSGRDDADRTARSEVSRLLTEEETKEALVLADSWKASHEPRPHHVQFSEADPCCSQSWQRGQVLKVVRYAGIVVSARFTDDGRHFVASLAVVNHGGTRFDVFPERCTVQTTSPLGMEVASLSFDRVKARRGTLETIAAAAAGASAGWNSTQQQQAGSATVHNPDGTTSQVDIYSRGPTDEQLEQQRANAAAAEERARERDQYNANVDTLILRATTVYPGKNVAGLVYFPREKKKQLAVLLRVPIENVVFEIPF